MVGVANRIASVLRAFAGKQAQGENEGGGE
jgi:hypothetical protein